MSTPPLPKSTVITWLNGCLLFFNNYTRDTEPFILNSKYLNRNSFHNVGGRQNYFSPKCGTSEGQSAIARACFSAFKATNNNAWQTLGLNVLNAFVNYYCLSDIPSNPTSPNDPLWLHHWICVAGEGGVTTQGLATVNDPFNFGFFDTTYSFVNGTANTGISSLAKVYKCHNGVLKYRNVYAPLASGSSYEIDYWVIDEPDYGGRFRIYFDGRENVNTGESVGLIKLKSGYTGTLTIVHSRYDNSEIATPPTNIRTGEGLIEPYPFTFKCVRSGKPKYLGTAFDAFWWSHDAFSFAFELTGDDKWRRARDAIKYTTIKAAIIENTSYWYKKENSTDPLKYPGSQIVQTNSGNNPLAGYTISRETITDKLNYIKIVVNSAVGGSFPTVELQNFVVQVDADDLSEIYIEAASNINNVYDLKISLNPDANNFTQEYIASFNVLGNNQPQNIKFALKDFVRWTTATIWHPSIAENPVYTYNGGTGSQATYTRIQNEVDGYKPVVVQVTLSNGQPGGFSGTGLVNINPTNTPPSIRYKMSGNCQIRITDSNGNFWYATLNNTASQWDTLPSGWSLYSGSGSPGSGNIQDIQFIPLDNNLVILSLYYAGALPERCPSPCRIYKGGVLSRLRDAHTFWIGDFKPQSNSLDKIIYNPGAVPFTVNSLNEVVSGWRGGTLLPAYTEEYFWYIWGYPERALQVLQFKSDAQDAYKRQSLDNLYAPVMMSFLTTYWDAADFVTYGQQNTVNGVPLNTYKLNEFSWSAPDPNTEWGGYQARTFAATSRYLRYNPTNVQAQKIVLLWLQYIDKFLKDNGKAPTNFKPQILPQALYDEPHILALIGKTALDANIAGLDTNLTYSVLSQVMTMLESNYQYDGVMQGSFTKKQPTFTKNSVTYNENFGFWHGEITEFLAEYVINIDLIKEPIQDTPGILPVIRPNYISEYVVEDLPISILKSNAGIEQRIQFVNEGSGKLLSIDYQKLPYSDMKRIVEFYNDCVGTLKFFTLPQSILAFEGYTGNWCFDSTFSFKPFISNKKHSLWDLSIKIKSL